MESLTFLDKPHLNRIEEGAFRNTEKLKVLDLSYCTYLSQIQDNAFLNSSIINIHLPEGLRLIGKRAFYNTNLSTLSLPNSVFWISDEAFLHCKIKSIFISNLSKLCIIGKSAFSYTELTSIFIPRNVNEIGASCFAFSKITQYQIDPQNPVFFLYQNFIYTHYTVIHSALPTLRGNIIIPAGATEILPTAFEGCQMETASLPPSLRRIDSYAFANSGLFMAAIPDNVEYIGRCAFFRCPNLTFLSVQSSSTVICEAAFAETGIKCGVVCPIAQIAALLAAGVPTRGFELCPKMEKPPCPDYYNRILELTNRIEQEANADPATFMRLAGLYGDAAERKKADAMVTEDPFADLAILDEAEKKALLARQMAEVNAVDAHVISRNGDETVFSATGSSDEIEFAVHGEIGDGFSFSVDEILENATEIVSATRRSVAPPSLDIPGIDNVINIEGAGMGVEEVQIDAGTGENATAKSENITEIEESPMPEPNENERIYVESPDLNYHEDDEMEPTDDLPTEESTPEPSEEPPEESSFEEPPTDEPPFEVPPIEEPPTEEPSIEEPTFEEPPIEEPSSEEPPIEEPPIEESQSEEPSSEEPPSEEPSEDQNDVEESVSYEHSNDFEEI